MNSKALIKATLVGTVAQVAMVVIGHVWAPAQAAFLWGGLALSLLAGLVYGRAAGGQMAGAAIGGLIAGGVCAFIGIAVSFALGDVAAPILAFGTLGSAVAGLLGGVIGRLIARPAASPA